jgi:hypothetical protein
VVGCSQQILVAFYRTSRAQNGHKRVSFLAPNFWGEKLNISFCLDLSYLYSKLVQTYSRGIEQDSGSNTPDKTPDTSDDEESQALIKPTMHAHFTPGAKKFMAM